MRKGNSLSKKLIISRLDNVKRDLPLIFAKRLWLIFTVVAFVVLSFGSVYFYVNAYSLPKKDFDVFVSSRKINTDSMESVLEFLEKEGGSVRVPPTNPFTK